MKHVFSVWLGLVLGSGLAWGQGSVNWGSISFGAMTAQTNATAYSPLFGGGATGGGTIGLAGNPGGGGPHFQYELLYGGRFNGSTNVAPATWSDLNSWSDSGLSATNAIIAGRLACIAPNSGATTPVGWDAGSTNYIILVGWSTNLGNTWTTVKSNLNAQAVPFFGQAFFGVSRVGYISPFAAGTLPGANLFAPTSTVSGLPIYSTNTQLYLLPLSYVLPPVIIVPPTNQTVMAGSSVSLSVQATNNSPITYQWLNHFVPVPDATNSVLTFNPALTNNTGNYSVVVANSSGCVTSSIAVLMVYQPVSIAIPPADQLVSYGDTATFGVSADSFPAASFQWYFNGTKMTGKTSSTLTIDSVTTNDPGSYFVVVTNAYSSAQSSSATLTMLPSLVVPFTGASGLWGQPGTLSVVAAGSGTLSYQWYLDGVAISGATHATYSISSLQLTNGGSYSVVVTSAYGSVTNVAATLTVRPSDVLFGIYAAITIQGSPGNSYSIEYSTNLVDWVTATNITLDQPSYTWSDYTVDFRSNPGRYYRAVPLP